MIKKQAGRIILLIFLVAGLGILSSFNPPTKLWELFGKTTFQEKLNQKHGLYFFYPQFSPDLIALKGKSVELEGFYIPLETSPSKTLILSKYPMAECFFCGGAGPESIAVVYLDNPPTRRPKLDQILKVRGILHLNANDVEEMTFILKNAELIN